MKLPVKIILILSVAVNCYFIVDEIIHYRIQAIGRALNSSVPAEWDKKIWKEGLGLFSVKLRDKHQALLNKKYYYLNVWTSSCKPCIKEMPWLDSIAGTLKKDVGYFFVTEMSDDAAEKSINRMNYSVKNFVFLNNMSEFISAYCNQNGTKYKSYPMALILSNKGELLFSSVGGYSNARESTQFRELINLLE